ncbi:unnamed protein product [Effrenium voratum]|nr:unnamed protein product [Effrenium voratum]
MCQCGSYFACRSSAVPTEHLVTMALLRVALLVLAVSGEVSNLASDDECADGTCSLELHQLRAKEAQAQLKSNFSAQCSSADGQIMAKYGSGNADGTFPKIVANCGKGAYSFWSGFNKNKMASCIVSQTKLSESCASCFGMSGQYGYDNCKMACLFGSWCSNRCLSCSNGNKATVDQCVGVPAPEVKQC